MPSTAFPAFHPDGAPSETLPESLLQALNRSLQQLKFGTIEIVVQDGRVVQINKTEKIRL
jgi:hypothetical protein